MSLVRGRYGILADAPYRVSDVEMVAAERELGVRLPESYRTFLRHFGTSALCRHQFFGFSRDRLRGDLVLLN
ncbi:MAG TPA: SMI1/KNR4 family protein, partial [Gemmataceae bacterium]|nr:SMI1/KNR4 family protein [Gemmataceae bacterium]